MEAALEVAARQDVAPEAQLLAFSLLIKIVSKYVVFGCPPQDIHVLEPPARNAEDASKYRCLNSNSNLLQQRLLRHGPAFEALLFALGFVRTAEPPNRAAAVQQQAEQQQQQEAEGTKRQLPKEHEPLRQPTQQTEQQQQQHTEQQQRTEQQHQEGGQSYYYYLPESVELSGLVEALQLLRATTESLKLTVANGNSHEQQCAAEDEAAAAPAVVGVVDASAGSGARPFPGTSVSLHATDGVKLPLTTSRAIRGQATSTHAKNQAALRQLREEQRERFEHRAETTRSTRSTAAAAAPAAVSRRDSGSRGGTDATSTEKKWSPEADAAPDVADAACAVPQAGARLGSGKKKLQKGSSSLQAAGRFFRKLCKGKSGGSLGKQRGGSAAT